MKRDHRLLAALALLVAAGVAAVVQAGIVKSYIYAAVMGNWTGFPNPPAKGPNEYCLDYCVADLPFLAGWIAVGSLLAALLFVALAWWKPKL